jgi:hypothetical protein
VTTRSTASVFAGFRFPPEVMDLSLLYRAVDQHVLLSARRGPALVQPGAARRHGPGLGNDRPRPVYPRVPGELVPSALHAVGSRPRMWCMG